MAERKRRICGKCGATPYVGRSCHTCWNKKRRAAVKVFLAEAKGVPCADCDTRFPPEAMDFDHVRGVKIFEINSFTVDKRKMVDVLLEIEKCEVVCSNCHRIRTAKQARRRAAK